MARINVSVPDPLYERLDRLRDRVNVSRVCTAALEKELDMIEMQPRPADPDVERLLRRLLSGQERWYRRGREDGRAWAVEKATRMEIWRIGANMKQVRAEQLVLAARQPMVPKPFPTAFPRSFPLDDALKRWQEQDAAADVDEVAYMQGWLDAVRELWETVAPALDHERRGAGERTGAGAGAPREGDSPAYRALEERLRASELDEVTLAFREIENLLGRALPESARKHRPWWSNDRTHSHARAWLDPGWRVASVDQQEEVVTFART